MASPIEKGSIHIAGAGEDGPAPSGQGEAHAVLAPRALRALEGEDVVAGERGGDPGEGGAGVLVHLEVLAAGVFRDLLEADLEGVPRRLR